MTEIKIQNVYKIYQSGTLRQRIETVALKNINLELKSGDFVTVMGPSGSGKTTLLNLLGGLDYPSAGKIIFEENKKKVNIANLSEGKLDYWRHNKIGIVFQSENLIPHLTALENVSLPLEFLGIKDTEKAVSLLTKLGLGSRLQHRIHQLSAGERQRVALAASLIFEPKILLADEPTGELDSATLAEVMTIFSDIHKQEEIIFFFVTHNPAVAKYGNKFFTLIDGRLENRDTPFSYDDFSSILGEYVVQIDKTYRILVPYDLLNDLGPKESMVALSAIDDNSKLQILVAESVDEELLTDMALAQVDAKGRILLPKDLRNIFKSKLLTGRFDQEAKRIILERRLKNDK
jgi:ABC-type lipoprotein export system ATPase subunit/bifunctional DNA-binding transcriptional regulator/antitoxin component of YhaV-PrlF toxin-antitoxin module